MTENRVGDYLQGPPTGADMVAFVRETKAGVWGRIDGQANRASEHSTVAALVPVSADGQGFPELRRPNDVRRLSRAHESRDTPRNAFIALIGIAAAVVLIGSVGAGLIGVSSWNHSSGPASGGSTGTSAPTPSGAALIDEGAAIAIARASNSASATAPVEARLMTFGAWTTEYDHGVSSSPDPSQLVWVVSVNTPSTFPGLGSPGSTVPPSNGYTVIINANTGEVFEFGAQPSTFHAATVAPAATDGPVATTKPSIASITDGKAPSDDEAVAFLKGDVASFPKVTDVYVRHSTVKELKSLLGGDSLPAGYPDELPVLLVTGVGTFNVSSDATGMTYTWGTMVIDATDGGLIGTFGQPGDVPELLLPEG